MQIPRRLRRLGMTTTGVVSTSCDTNELVRTFMKLGFRAVVACADLKQLDASFAGRESDAAFLKDLPAGVKPSGENGEFHSFVFAGPLFGQSASRPAKRSRATASASAIGFRRELRPGSGLGELKQSGDSRNH